ncbi:MAG: DUF3136 domain-containing protein [Synechococcus sp. MED-G71]|nr:MAG: DUF3136 domain-containing protein [Synechococcus sp. MED-G71]|tara:strand:- start:1620 stop:1835 length:216 start_codon:yes stop_codon:yes gene_type:complete
MSEPKITIGELEAKYPLYCQVLGRLVEEGRSVEAIQRTLCWDRLALLHHCLPNRYKDPDHLLALLRRPQAA